MSNDLDLSGLPEELLKQLSSGNRGRRQFILDIIKENGGKATIDKIIISIYRKTKKVTRRSALYQLLLKMRKDGLISKDKLIYRLVDKTKNH